jgi:regulator of protease activity HflC (stomatin/prohibitin superfamily)
LIYPFLGEELRIRVPLTVQLTWFEDERVLTREAVQLKVKVAIWWQVSDLERFFYQIDSEVHRFRDGMQPLHIDERATATPVPRGQLGMAELWLRTLAESCLRKLVSETNTLHIVSKQVSSGLMDGHGLNPDGDSEGKATPDAISELLKSDLAPKANGYGLLIDRIEVQEVQLPASIQQAITDVMVAATQPKKTAHEAEALKMHLKVLVETIGQPAAGMIQVVERIPSSNFLGNPLAMIESLFAQLGETQTRTKSSQIATTEGASVPETVLPTVPTPPK